MVATRQFYEGLGAICYAVAASDNELEKQELMRLGDILLESFSDWDLKTKGQRAYARFEMFADAKESAENAYALAMDLFSKSTPELKESKDVIIKTLEATARADELMEPEEIVYIDRFKADAEKLIYG